MRILYVTPDISWPPRVGGQIRKWNVLQGLLQAGTTDALVFRRGETDIHAQSFAGCERVVPVSHEHFQLSDAQRRQYESTFGRSLLTLRSLLPLEYRAARRATLREELHGQVDFACYDVIWFATARSAAPLGWIRGPAATVLDGDDFSYVREWHLLRSSPWYGAKIWNYLDVAKLWWWERTHPRRFTIVVRCSDEDLQRLPAKNVVVIPNGTDVPPAPARSPQARVLFVGDLAYVPNSQGMEWFLEHIWPDIRRRVPHAALDIAGRQPSAAIQNAHGRAGVTVHGFVQSLDPLFESAALTVVPLLAGGGTRLKILESLAYGVPVVSTHLGAFGIRAGSEEGLDRTDSPAQFAEKCAAALLDPASAQARALRGRELVQREYDWRVIQASVARTVERAAATVRSASLR